MHSANRSAVLVFKRQVTASPTSADLPPSYQACSSELPTPTSGGCSTERSIPGYSQQGVVWRVVYSMRFGLSSVMDSSGRPAPVRRGPGSPFSPAPAGTRLRPRPQKERCRGLNPGGACLVAQKHMLVGPEA